MWDDVFNVLFHLLPRPVRIGCMVLFGVAMVAGAILMFAEWLRGAPA